MPEIHTPPPPQVLADDIFNCHNFNTVASIKVSFSFPQIIPKITQTYTLYDSLVTISFYHI